MTFDYSGCHFFGIKVNLLFYNVCLKCKAIHQKKDVATNNMTIKIPLNITKNSKEIPNF